MKDCMFKLILQGSCKMPVMWKAAVAIARLANCLCSAHIAPIVDSYAVAMQPCRTSSPKFQVSINLITQRERILHFIGLFCCFQCFLI